MFPRSIIKVWPPRSNYTAFPSVIWNQLGPSNRLCSMGWASNTAKRPHSFTILLHALSLQLYFATALKCLWYSLLSGPRSPPFLKAGACLSWSGTSGWTTTCCCPLTTAGHLHREDGIEMDLCSARCQRSGPSSCFGRASLAWTFTGCRCGIRWTRAGQLCSLGPRVCTETSHSDSWSGTFGIKSRCTCKWCHRSFECCLGLWRQLSSDLARTTGGSGRCTTWTFEAGRMFAGSPCSPPSSRWSSGFGCVWMVGSPLHTCPYFSLVVT